MIMDDVVIAKGVSIAIIFCGSLFCGLLPAFSIFATFPRFALSLILSYGGGILIATSLVHILPEAKESWPHSSVFTAEMTLCVGIFIVYIIEEVAHFLVCHDIHSPLGHNDGGEGHGHNHGVHVHHDDPPNRCDEPAAVFLFAEEKSRGDHDRDMESCINHNHHHHCTEETSHSHHKNKTLVSVVANSGCHDHCCGDGPDSHHSHSNRDASADKATDKLFPQSLNETKVLPDDKNRKPDGPAPRTLAVKLRSLVGLIALSVHAGLEGLAVGLGRDATDVWFLCGAVAAHKLVIAFCLGMEVRIASTSNECSSVKTSSSASFKFRYVLFFALMTPMGILIGTVITHLVEVPGQKTEPTIVAVLQALAAGTLLYVAFFEVILRERARFSGKGLSQLGLVILGWATMVIVEIVLQSLGHSHGNSLSEHEHDDDHHH